MIVNPILFWMCLIAGFVLITSETYTLFTKLSKTAQLAAEISIVCVLTVHNLWRIYSICGSFDSVKDVMDEIPKSFVLITGVFLFSWISSFSFLQMSLWYDGWAYEGHADKDVFIYPFVITMTGVPLNAMIGVYLESKEVMIRMMPFLLFWYKVSMFDLTFRVGMSKMSTADAMVPKCPLVRECWTVLSF